MVWCDRCTWSLSHPHPSIHTHITIESSTHFLLAISLLWFSIFLYCAYNDVSSHIKSVQVLLLFSEIENNSVYIQSRIHICSGINKDNAVMKQSMVTLCLRVFMSMNSMHILMHIFLLVSRYEDLNTYLHPCGWVALALCRPRVALYEMLLKCIRSRRWWRGDNPLKWQAA